MSDTVETEKPKEEGLLTMTTNIVSAYLSHNQMARTELNELISSVHGTLTGLSNGTATSEAAAPAQEPAPVPAVPIDASVQQDAIICLEDGKPFKTLKRHLRVAYNMSPEEYREKWGLSKDYPMVAPSYSARRAETAKKIGLGRKPGATRRKKK